MIYSCKATLQGTFNRVAENRGCNWLLGAEGKEKNFSCFSKAPIYGTFIVDGKKVPRKRRSRGKKPEALFAAVKVKMVMRIYGVSRAQALEIIAKRESEAKAADKENGNGEI